MSLTSNIILKAAILEEALKVYKVAAYHELKSVEKYNSEFSDAAKKHTNLETYIDNLLDEVAKLINNILKNEKLCKSFRYFR